MLDTPPLQSDAAREPVAAELVSKALNRMALPANPIAVAGSPARFTLFYAPPSICSQKVCSVLAHHNIPYVG